MIGEWNKSVIITYVGMAFAIVGISMAFMGKVSQAFACLVVAGVCDLFDGMVARRCQRSEAQKQFGIQLDSLVDVMSFLALPVTIGLKIGMDRWYYILVLIVFCVCGIARLAYFNVTTEGGDGPVAYYRGLPVTYSALILPLTYLLCWVMPQGLFLPLYALVMLVVAGVQVLDVKIIKPRGIAYAGFSLLAIVVIILYLVVLS